MIKKQYNDNTQSENQYLGGHKIMNICVYGASSAQIDKSYVDQGEKLGELLVKRGHGLVFGGGANGLMGATARGVYRAGGNIVGVVPTFFNVDGLLFDHCTELIRTETMRERKQIMEDRSDAFIMSPGGIGTFEEFFEILTLKQLGRHQKAIVVLDLNGYYQAMIEMIEQAIEHKFMTPACKQLFFSTDNVEEALDYIDHYVPEGYNILEMKDFNRSVLEKN